jgi:N,N'-diacetyllegionaminate synthase
MSKVMIIAEAGVNHNGSLELAKKLIQEAKNAGADYVKFQSFKTEKLVSKFAEKAEYQKKNTSNTETQFDMIKKLELSDNDHDALVQFCKEVGIGFSSSPFDNEGIVYLDSLGVDFFKVPSGEITNLPYLKELAKFNRPIILSTGMASLSEVQDALSILKGKDVTVLHCNTEYPTPMQDVNLKAMLTIKEKFNVKVGYSDHTLGIEIPIAAVALGAVVIEKHFTINKEMEGPDHKASLEPYELKNMVQAIRNIEKALGNGVKEPSPSEKKNINIARKSIVAAKEISQGELFTIDNITVKRPGSGISPMKWESVLGKKALRKFSPDELIEL